MADLSEKQYEFHNLLHSAHLQYIRRGSVNSLSYLFKILDALDPEKRNKMLDMVKRSTL